jgi:hypothetical protein
MSRVGTASTTTRSDDLSLFRRGEPLHVRLAREGGLSLGDEAPPRPPWDTAGIHGLHRPREWDAVLTAQAPALEGDRSRFVALSSDVLLVEEGPDDVEPLAIAVEGRLAPPYRAEAVRRESDLWAVAARAIEVVQLPGVRGSEIELAAHAGERTLVVDGQPTFGTIPALERPEQVVRARRLDGDTWEIVVDRL